MTTTLILIGSGVAAAGWLARQLFGPTTGTAGERLRDWLLPAGKPWTYRLVELTGWCAALGRTACVRTGRRLSSAKSMALMWRVNAPDATQLLAATSESSTRPLVFAYLASSPSTLSPMIPVTLKLADGRTAPFAGLIDSGADTSVFPLELAEMLGLSLTDATSQTSQTLGGATEVLVWPGHIAAEIAGHPVRLSPVFVDGQFNLILGRRDFFSSFAVSMNEREQSFSLMPLDP